MSNTREREFRCTLVGPPKKENFTSPQQAAAGYDR
jgi:hypothetical protein